jgi:diguanylate cyclase (GGDEF)-like protein/PAS domain S-box-containing protein
MRASRAGIRDACCVRIRMPTLGFTPSTQDTVPVGAPDFARTMLQRARAGGAWLLLALLLAGAPGPAGGASVREFYFQRLGSEQGLLQQTVTALVQDPQGFVWVGTQGGLHRYDGQRFVAWRHDPRDPEGMPDSFATALAVDGDALWIGTYSQYVVRLDLVDGRFRRYRPDDAAASAGSASARSAADADPGRHQVRALLPQHGRLWVATAAGLERLDPQTGGRDIVLRLVPAAAAAPWHSLSIDGEDALWYGSGAGLYRVGPRGGIARIGPAEPVRHLARDSRGRLWVGRSDGLHRLSDNGRDLVRAWPLDGSPAPVQAIVEAPDRHLWLSIPGQGLVRLEPATGTVAARVRENAAIPGNLHEDAASTLMIDRGGMLWAGGGFRGIAIADPRGARFSYLANIEGGSAADSSVRALAQDDEGDLWVATDLGQLLRLSLPGSRFEDHTALLPDMPAGPGALGMRVMGFSRAAPDRLWMATTRGLMLLDARTRRIVPITLEGLDAPGFRSIARDARGDLWLGTTREGLVHYRPGTGHWRRAGDRTGPASGGDRDAVHAVHVDRRGRVWFGTGDGLGLLEPGSSERVRRFRHGIDDTRSLAGNLVRAIHEDAAGTIWIGSHAGLSRVHEHPGRRIDFDHPLAAALPGQVPPTVFSIAESPPGILWLGSNAGILRYDTASARARGYTLADGLQDIEFNGGAVAELADGRLAFGGVRGLNLFDPARIAGSRYMPPVRLLSARIGADAQEGRVPWQPGELRVPGDAALLRLRVGALDYSPAAKLRYRYRMHGFDRDWVDNGASGEITFTRLPPGDYLLQVQAGNSDGLWNPDLLEVPVRMQPPAWRTPWAITGYVLAALLLLGSLGWLWHSRRQRERGYFRQIREREERLKLALWASGEQFWDYDLRRGELHWLRAEESGQAPDIGVQTSVGEDHRIHEEDLPQVRERLRQHLDGIKPVFLSEHRVRNEDGAWTWVRTRGRVVERDAQGRALRVAGTARDITISRRAEREHRIASEVLRSMTEAVAVFDRDFRFVGINPAFARMTGYGEAEVVGRPTSLLDSSQHDPDFYSQMRLELERNGRWSGEMWQQRKDGDEFLCWIQGGVVHDSSGQRSHYVAVLSDITDQKRAEQELRYLANYDTLTSLPNRALLSERLSRAIVRARRQGNRIAVLFLDLDRFKDVNDSLGHAAGDRILRAAATRLQDTVGAQHTVARLGGDEFTVVLEDLDAPEDAEKVAREVITAFEAPLEIDENQDVTISPSIGISLYPDNAQVPTDLLKHADTAMYQAKAAGRRTYMRYTESMDVHIRHRATVSGALRKVLDRGELRLVFQPQLSLSHARITGVEALLRWNSAEHGEIPPAQFIPLAEESGLILEIGEWALREACFTLKRWRQHGLDRLSMAVNVSSLQLLRGDLPAVVARILEETGVPASCLELELTESVIMANAEQTMATLQAFRALGVTLAIDDFGTGYSSLAYLKRLPINTLKIDKEFIGDLTRDPDDEAITSTVITMARSLELTVVAEGVETEAQVQFLREHGCDLIQGYWLSPPLDPHSCLAFIRTWAPTLTSTPAA